jgi:hypothetical protein
MVAAASSPYQPGPGRYRFGEVPARARTNGLGLDGEMYVPLLDTAPERTDGLLLALRRAGIPAYAAPTPRRRPRSRPGTDRIWVQVWGRARAEDVVHAEFTPTRRPVHD